jgi:hypothetical protein
MGRRVLRQSSLLFGSNRIIPFSGSKNKQSVQSTRSNKQILQTARGQSSSHIGTGKGAQTEPTGTKGRVSSVSDVISKLIPRNSQSALLKEPPIAQPLKNFPTLFWYGKMYNRVNKSPPLVPILSQINPVHTTSSLLSYGAEPFLRSRQVCSVYGYKIVDKKEILRSVPNTGIYCSSGKVGTV